jgi:hypothetical protein
MKGNLLGEDILSQKQELIDKEDEKEKEKRY